MKKYLIFIIFMFILSCASTKVYVKNEHKLSKVKKIAVLPFLCNKQEIGLNIASSLSSNLVVSKYIVIERTQLNRILQEQGLTLTGVVEDYNVAIGKIKGIDALIVGNATVSQGWAGTAFGGYIDYVSNCNARLIDLETGEVLLATTFTSESASTYERYYNRIRSRRRISTKNY
jgi:curli biogenesis system outer membrane secretion channel CsgG